MFNKNAYFAFWMLYHVCEKLEGSSEKYINIIFSLFSINSFLSEVYFCVAIWYEQDKHNRVESLQRSIITG